MPSIAQETISPVSGKKRRREDGGGSNSIDIQTKISSPHRQPLYDNPSTFNHTLPHGDLQHIHDRKQILPKRGLHDSKRQRIEISPVRNQGAFFLNVSSEQEHSYQGTIDLGTRAQDDLAAREERKTRVDLNPCHICHRKPTEKRQLDAFADCEGCRKRTCWICIRECEGLGVLNSNGRVQDELKSPNDFVISSSSIEREDWEVLDAISGDQQGIFGETRNWDKERIPNHRGRICSRCCVERGTEGEVWCLGCVRAEEAVEVATQMT